MTLRLSAALVAALALAACQPAANTAPAGNAAPAAGTGGAAAPSAEPPGNVVAVTPPPPAVRPVEQLPENCQTLIREMEACAVRAAEANQGGNGPTQSARVRSQVESLRETLETAYDDQYRRTACEGAARLFDGSTRAQEGC